MPERRESLFKAIKSALRATVPPRPRGYLTFGWLIVLLLLVQVFTGTLLSVYYSPTPETAAASVKHIMRDVSSGWLVRGLHHWSSAAIIVLGVLQLIRVVGGGLYRRSVASWYLGCLLLVVVLALAFTGELLPWDNHAYWSAMESLERIESLPLIGPALASVLRGNQDVGAHTLSLAHTAHVLFLPGICFTLLFLNLWLFARQRANIGRSDKGED